jgi:flavin reductase (DIM6/NTAB) family NADH-FMN oxidoreductase RutF
MERRNVLFSEHSPAATYHLLTAMVVPRPIAWIATLNDDKSINLAPFSFFNVVCANPPLAVVGIGRRSGEQKDTARNLGGNGECVIHLPHLEEAAAVQASAADLPYGKSEADLLELASEASQLVQVPRLKLKGLQIEARLKQWIDAGQSATDIALLELLCAHVPENAMDDRGRVLVDVLNPLARTSSGRFAATGDEFKIP